LGQKWKGSKKKHAPLSLRCTSLTGRQNFDTFSAPSFPCSFVHKQQSHRKRKKHFSKEFVAIRRVLFLDCGLGKEKEHFSPHATVSPKQFMAQG